MDRRSEALAQLLETALSERFATPVTELLQAMPIPVAIVQATDLRVLTLNELMGNALSRDPRDAVGLPVVDLTPPAHPLSDPRPYRAVARRHRPFETTVVIGTRQWLWFIRPLTGNDQAVEHLLVGLVVSAPTLPDNELGRLYEANATKTEFLHMAAHELRTPLAVIHGYASLLAPGGLSPEHQRLAGLRIYEKAKQLSRLIMDMSLMARIDELGPSLPTDAVDLIGLLGPMVDELRRRFGDLAIDLQFAAAAAWVPGSDYWLGLALRELLDNAIRFRPGPTGRIDLAVTRADERWRVSVVDDGFGIHPSDQGLLFKRFSRIETEQNRHLVGMGIGLYLVSEVALAHQGRVAVHSRPAAGSEFILELPAVLASGQ
ncbi:MAG TPA: ATP-binding protein [Candidatus Dormibacteraeota bacterium]